MAHPCIYCDGDCYCHGDIDDVIVSKTPLGCEGCGCEEFAEDQGWIENYDNDWDDDEDYISSDNVDVEPIDLRHPSNTK